MEEFSVGLKAFPGTCWSDSELGQDSVKAWIQLRIQRNAYIRIWIQWFPDPKHWKISNISPHASAPFPFLEQPFSYCFSQRTPFSFLVFSLGTYPVPFLHGYILY